MDATPSSVSPRATPIGRRLAGVALVTVVQCAVLSAALVFGTFGPRGAGVAMWVGGSVLLLGSTGLALRRWEGRTSLSMVAGALAGLVVPVWFIAQTSWSEPLVWATWRCGTGDIGLLMLGAPMTVMLTIAGALAGARIGGRHRPRWSRAVRGLRWAVVAMVVLGLVTVTLGLGKPAAEDWYEGFPAQRLRFDASESEAGAVARRRLAEDAVLERRCYARDWDAEVECSIRVQRGDDPLPKCEEGDHACPESGMLAMAPGAELWARHDPVLDAWLVDQAEGSRRLTVFGPDGPMGVTPPQLGDAIAPPASTVWLFFLGLLVAAPLQGFRRRLDAERAAVRAGREGVSDGHDVRFSDGELPAHAELEGEVDPGLVVVVEASSDVRRASYRDDGQAGRWRALPGKRPWLLHELGRTIAGLDFCTVVVVVLTSVPLLVTSPLW